VLVTVGGAVNLLGTPQFSKNPIESPTHLEMWAAAPDMRWINAWAIWDPVPAGPLALTGPAARRRWAACRRSGAALEALEQLEASDSPPPERVDGLPGFVLDLYNLQQPAARLPGQIYETGGIGETLARLAGDPLTSPELAVAERAALAEADRQRAETREQLEEEARRPTQDVGPEEWPLHNMCSLVSDHVTYTQNREQLIRRLALLALDPTDSVVNGALPAPTTESREGYEREKSYTASVRRAGMLRLLSLPVGAVTSAAFLSPFVTDILGWAEGSSGKLDWTWEWAWRLTAEYGIRNWVLYSVFTILIAATLMAFARVLSRWDTAPRTRPWRLFALGLVTTGLACLSVSVLWRPSWWLVAIPILVVMAMAGLGPSRLAPTAQHRPSGARDNAQQGSVEGLDR
jgi:hypothetical protein